jgi:hypothetical protein
MKINFTKKEYRLLVEMLHIAEWIANAHAVNPIHEEYIELREKILSHYEEMEAADIIEYSKELDGHYELANFEEEIREKFIIPYDENVFWDELRERLSVRDVIREVGVEKFRSMSGFDRSKAIDKVSERYATEFRENGLEHIKVEYNNVVKKPFREK